MRSSLAVLWGIVISLAVGCAESSQPAANQPTADRSETGGQGEEVAGQFTLDDTAAAPMPGDEQSPAMTPPTSEPSPAAPSVTGGVARQAFLAANEEVSKIMADLIKTLDGVTDEESARQAAPRMAELTTQWKSSAQTATAAYLALDESIQDKTYKEAGMASQAKAVGLELKHGKDLIEQVQRVAQVGGPAIEQELTAFRDTYLSTRSIYSPVTARERMSDKLGPAGSPLTTK